MKIRVKLFASLRDGRFDERETEVEGGTSIAALAAGIDLPTDLMAVIFVNGRHADLQTILREGDILAIFPPVGGG